MSNEHTITITNITIDERKLIDMYLSRFDVDIIDDESYVIVYRDEIEGVLINQYVEQLRKVVEICIERK
jgi:hypothetical protein